jgi:hypothetical protein
MLIAKECDWRAGDATDVLRGSTIVGRAVIEVEGGTGRKNGIVIEKDGRRWAFYWDNPDSDSYGRFVILPLSLSLPF